MPSAVLVKLINVAKHDFRSSYDALFRGIIFTSKFMDVLNICNFIQVYFQKKKWKNKYGSTTKFIKSALQ